MLLLLCLETDTLFTACNRPEPNCSQLVIKKLKEYVLDRIYQVKRPIIFHHFTEVFW